VTYRLPLGHFLPLKDAGLSGAFFATQGRESDLSLAETPIVHHSKKRSKRKGAGGVCELKIALVGCHYKDSSDLKKEYTSNAFAYGLRRANVFTDGIDF